MPCWPLQFSSVCLARTTFKGYFKRMNRQREWYFLARSYIAELKKNNVPNNLQVLSKHYYPHFVNEESEVHRSWVTCLQSNSQTMASASKSKKLSPGPLLLAPGQLSPHNYIITYHDVTSTQKSILHEALWVNQVGASLGLNSILLRACDQKTCAIQFFPHMPLLSWPITGGLCSVVCLRPIIISPL